MKACNEVVAVVLAAALSAAACSSVITREGMRSDPAAHSSAMTEDGILNELVSFMIDFLIQQEFGDPNYVRTIDLCGVLAWPYANIIVWSPPIENASENDIKYVKSDEPLRVWIYGKNQLVEAADKKKAIQEYKSNHMANGYRYGYHEFGIMSMSSNSQEAKVFYGYWLGPIFGGGKTMLTLKRSRSGKWEIMDAQRI